MHRNKLPETRKFCENFSRRNSPGNRESYPYTYPVEVIRSLKTLDFGGSDDLCNWADRAKGISLFSIAPTDDLHRGAMARAEMLAYENTESNHTPADAQRMAALSAMIAQIPADRLAVKRWVDHADIFLTIHLSSNLTVLVGLQRILQFLQNPNKFSHYKAANYRALIWLIHRALRSFFVDGDVGPMDAIAWQLHMNGVIAAEGVPDEMMEPEVVTDSSSMGTDMSSLSGGSSRKRGAPPGFRHQQQQDGQNNGRQYNDRQYNDRQYNDRQNNDRQNDDRQNNDRPPQWVSTLQSDIMRAREACKPDELRGRQLTRGLSVQALFGRDFCALMESGKQPCLKFFLMGGCNYHDCRNAHRLQGPPSTAMLKGLQTKVKAACDHIVQHPKD
jgi:hypothetical protein